MISCAIVLAAGAGRRYGQPKVFATDTTGRLWLERVVAALRAGGCDEVLVVIGADADRARGIVAGIDGARSVDVVDWAGGLSSSVRAGLTAAAATDADTAVIAPVDVPGMPSTVVTRVLRAASDPAMLARAVFDGRPGHPVVIGREHWAAVAASVQGDSGANRYLETHGTLPVECADLWDGADTDTRR